MSVEEVDGASAGHDGEENKVMYMRVATADGDTRQRNFEQPTPKLLTTVAAALCSYPWRAGEELDRRDFLRSAPAKRLSRCAYRV